MMMMMMVNGDDSEWWLWCWSRIMSRRVPLMTLIDKDEECESIQCLFVHWKSLFKTYWPRERALKLMAMVRLTLGLSQRGRTRRLATPSTPTPAQWHMIKQHRSHFHTSTHTFTFTISLSNFHFQTFTFKLSLSHFKTSLQYITTKKMHLLMICVNWLHCHFLYATAFFGL